MTSAIEERVETKAPAVLTEDLSVGDLFEVFSGGERKRREI